MKTVIALICIMLFSAIAWAGWTPIRGANNSIITAPSGAFILLPGSSAGNILLLGDD